MSINSCAGRHHHHHDRDDQCGGSDHGHQVHCHPPACGGNSGGAGSAAQSGSSTTAIPGAPSSIDAAMQQMRDAFDEAIKTNAEITSVKTALGSVETVAQQRPNVG